jgi:hypothetical protein
MRLPRFRLRTLMFGIAILALTLTVFVQEVLLRQAALREQQLRAALAQAEAEKAWTAAINEWNDVSGSESMQKQWAAAMNYSAWIHASARSADRQDNDGSNPTQP